jgi:hypothetical protein
VTALDQTRRVCAVEEPYEAPLPVTTSPLLRYLDERFTPIAADRYFRVTKRE